MAITRAAECGLYRSLDDIMRLVTAEDVNGDKYLLETVYEVEVTALDCGESDTAEDIFNQLLLYNDVTGEYSIAVVQTT